MRGDLSGFGVARATAVSGAVAAQTVRGTGPKPRVTSFIPRMLCAAKIQRPSYLQSRTIAHAAARARYSFANPTDGFASTAPFQADVKSLVGELKV